MGDAALNQQLIEAGMQGNLTEVKRLVDAGAEINLPGKVSNVLFESAYRNRGEVVSWLLDHGADTSGRNGTGSTALMGAAEQGAAEAVRILLSAGANAELKNDSGQTARVYAARHNHAAIVALFDRNPDEVTFSWRVNNRTLQEVFNFAHKERVTLIRNGTDGPVEAVQRESFSELADKSGLRKAFEEYKKHGGKREEDEIFSDALPKLKLKMKEM